MDFLKRPLAITDIETTGFDAQIHEIIELGLVLVDQKSLKVLDEFEVKIKPQHIKTASEKALKVNGYNKLDWLEAVDLKEAMKIYSKKTNPVRSRISNGAGNAIFLAHNSFFDWSFITEAFKSTGVEDYTDYHRLDLFSIAWSRNRIKQLKGLTKFNLSEMCKYFGIEPESMPHRAINGARKELEVLKKLLAT